MECLTEFTCSVFVDGELTGTELRNIEEHLETCEHCSAMSAALREENRMLVACIQEIDLPDAAHAASPVTEASPVAPSVRPAEVLKAGGLLIGLASLIQLAMASPENLVLPSLPESLNWLNPSNLSGKLNWLMGGIAFVAAEGVSKMTSLVNSLSVLALFVLILAGAAILVRRSIGRGAMVAALGLLLVVVSSTPSYAMDFRNAGQNKIVTIPAGQTVDDSVVATGDTVIVDGIINGDLIAIARRVTINGTVKGNVITGGSSIEVPGTVEGSIAIGGQNIQFTGKVAHNLISFGAITIGKEAAIGGDVAGFGNDVHMNGNVAHNFYAFGVADIAGTVGRNVTFNGSTLSILPTARIAGDLKAHVPTAEMIRIDPAAVISGKQTIELPKPGPSRYSTFSFYFSEIVHVAAAFITGLILMLIFPRLRGAGFADVVSVLKSGGIGFLLLVATPIAALIVAVTMIGFPIAVVGFVGWVLGMYLAKIIIANFLGRTLLSSSSDRMSSVALGLIVGLVLIFTIINLPYIGGLIHFILILVGFGALARSVYGSFQTVPDSGR